MKTPAVRDNNFKKAMSSIVLSAGAALADAERTIDKAGPFKRKIVQQELQLAMEFCRLLIEPVSPAISRCAEGYCRKHLIVATEFLRHEMATRNPGSPECKRLIRIAGLIEENLRSNLDEETAKFCWLGNDGTVVRNLEKHSSFG